MTEILSKKRCKNSWILVLYKMENKKESWMAQEGFALNQ